MRTALIFLFIFQLMPYALQAQQKRLTYIDSAMEFLAYWKKEHKRIEGSRLLDNTALNHMDSLLFIGYKGDRPFDRIEGKVYQRDLNDSGGWKIIDSVPVERRDIKLMTSQWKHPMIAKWDATVFPGCRIVTQEQVDSFFKAYFKLCLAPSSAREKDHYEDSAWAHTPVYNTLQLMKKDEWWQKGYWKISNPVFIKGGRFAVLIYWHFYENTFITYDVGLYKKTNNKWAYFGYIRGGDVN